MPFGERDWIRPLFYFAAVIQVQIFETNACLDSDTSISWIFP